jgi:hypothetical protein
MCDVTSPADLHILNGAVAEFSIPCNYVVPDEQGGTALEPIRLSEEGYGDPVVAFDPELTGLSWDAWIDEDDDSIIKLVFSAECPEAISQDLVSQVSVLITRDEPGRGLRTDVVVRGPLTVFRAPLPSAGRHPLPRRTADASTPEYYGAVGDGVTDDFMAMRDCFLANAGKEVRFANEAEYLLGSRISMGSVDAHVPAPDIIGNGSRLLINHQLAALRVSSHRKGTTSLFEAYTTGDDKLWVQDPSYFQPGDLVRVICEDLYHPSRYYFYKGGSTIVREVIGEDVYITDPFPFDMRAEGGATLIHVYRPQNFTFGDFEVVNLLELSGPRNGIQVESAFAPRFENISVDNFETNVILLGCVDSVLDRYRPGRSYYEGISGSYGINLSGCNGTTFLNSRLVSGRHGLTHGGLIGVNFDTTLINCTVGAEKTVNGDERGLATHTNTYSMTVIGGQVNGFVITGNCSFNNVKFGSNINNFIIPAASKDRCNVKFDNCDFGDENRYIYCRDTSDAPETNKIGALVFDNFRGTARIDFRGRMADDITPKPNNVGLLRIRNTDTGIYQWNQDAGSLTTFDAVDVVYYGTQPPSTGAWRRDMIFMNTEPSAGGYIGWVCVSSGTPGTWKGFGAIQA